MQSIWRADPEKNKQDESDNVPEGFKKFLKKTRQGSGSKKSGDKEAQKEAKSDKDDKKKKQEEDEDDLTDIEDEKESEGKDGDKKKEDNEYAKKAKQFFFQPNGKDPKWENFGLVAFLVGAFGYNMLTMK